MEQLLPNIKDPSDIRELSIKDLDRLAQEIREVIIRQVSETGGHLASNLGSVELTLALHSVFDTPRDRLIWDVGHQAYPHKLITGRYEQFHTLKQFGGLSGFLSRKESEYDSFGTGHASTSYAAAMGFAVARTRQQQDHHVIAVIGDGSITGGMAYEALNNAGASEENIIFVLNDNKMSIAPNVGAVSRLLNRIISNPTYNKLKEDIWGLTGKIPKGSGFRKMVSKIDDTIKHLILPGGFFEALGIRYFGPIDGHNIRELKEIFQQLKKIQRPCLVHVLTEKGHGWDLAAKDAYKWHASPPFHIESGEKKSSPSTPSLASVMGTALLELAREDEQLIAITAAMADGTGLDIMQAEFPDRVFDVGIAEQYAVTFAGGLACEGMKPVVAIYSSFLQRSVDQVIHDIALQKLNVVFTLSHSGLVGEDGATHHGAMDITYLRMIPNLTIMAPSDEIDLRNMLYTALKQDSGPIAIRFSKGAAPSPDRHPPFQEYEIGIPRIIQEGEGLLILSLGHMLQNVKEAAEILTHEGCRPTVVDARFAKPLHTETYFDLISRHTAVLTVEDNVIAGGYGSAVSELMSNESLFDIPVKHIGLPDTFVPHGKRELLYASLGMDAEGIAEKGLWLHRQAQKKLSLH